MSYFGTAVEYFNQFKSVAKSNFQIVNKKWQAAKGLQRAFYFFDLQQGCKLIALFEALVSLVRICWIYYLVYRSDTKAIFPDTTWVYYWSNGRKNYVCYHHTNYYFHVGLHLITIFNSMLLFVGIKWAIVSFLYYWIYITQFTAAITYVDEILTNFSFSQVYFIIPKLTLQYYYFVVVLSLIWKIREMQKSKVVEIKEAALEIEEE